MINKNIRPEDVLPENENYTVIDGIKVRKGTIAAVLQNAVILSSSLASNSEKEAAKKTITELAPGIVVLGMHEHVTWKNPSIQKIIEDAIKKLSKITPD